MTTTTRKTDVIDRLLAQHQHIRSLFAEVADSSGDVKQRKFEELRRFLAVHETAEELITHPRVRMAGANDVVDARLEEETEGKKLLAAMDGMDVSAPDFDVRLAALRTAVLDHAEAEEREEFPLLREAADDRQLRVMALAMQAVEAIAPTHPHPSVGSSMTTNLMAGPLASVVDRTRDAVSAVLRRG
jgi:hemerythrin superfamily protein